VLAATLAGATGVAVVLTQQRAVAQAPAATSPSSPSSPSSATTATLYAEVRGSDGTSIVAAPERGSLVEVLEQGLPRPLVAAEAPSGDGPTWSILVYADLPLSSPAGLASAAEALGAAAERLVSLGEVDVVVASTAARSLTERGPLRDAAGVRVAMQELRRQATSAGELTRRRQRLSADATEAEDAAELRRLVADHRFEEAELRSWQQDQLEDWLLGVAEEELPAVAERPRLLILLRDALDASPESFLQELRESMSEDREVEPTPTAITPNVRQRELARAASALGWIALPVRLGGAEAVPGAVEEPDSDLAEATGGALVRDAAALDAELLALRHRWRIRFETSSASGEPTPVDVRATTAGVHVRAPRWVSGLPPELLAMVRGRRLLEDGVPGSLELVAILFGELRGGALLEAAVPLSALPSTGTPLRSDRLRVTVLRLRLDHDPEVTRFRGAGLELRGDRWILQTPISTPDDLQDVVVVAEDLATGSWGATFAEPSETSLAAESRTAVVETLGVSPPPARAPQPAPPEPAIVDRAAVEDRDSAPAPQTASPPDVLAQPAPRPAPGSARFPALKVVPPRGRDLTGPQEFNILLSMDSIRRVEFYLDGELVVDDTRRPFSARLDLGTAVREHEVRAVGYSRDGIALGEDVLRVNAPRALTTIRVTESTPVPGSDAVDVGAELELLPGLRLDRVELFRNETLGATLTRPPFRARLPGPARSDADYVRVVAYLEDGTMLEDVRLLGSDAALSERVEVNLVEVYAVVTDANGEVIEGLQQSDFELRLGRETIPIERFAVADEVPLVVGLAIDTSGSMWTLMPDTRNAASRFLGQVLRSGDQGFVVEFSDRPRLAHPPSTDPFALMRSIGRLEAGGNTALYDSVVFSLLQFEPGLGRKAVVLLTDGTDYNSKFSYRRTHRTAAQAGLPVYFVALGGLEEDRPVFRKDDLELIADVSGGRVFYVRGMDDIYGAYARISRELRSQYVIAFTTAQPLADDELARVRVSVKGPKRQVRFAVGRQ
jgi:VWFA-related protein